MAQIHPNHLAAPYAGTDFIPLESGPLPVPFTGEDAATEEPQLVIAVDNIMGVPADTLGVYVCPAPMLTNNDHHWIDWFMDGPGQATRKIMRNTEFHTIAEG